METGLAIGYLHFIIALLLLTGIAILWIDVRSYKQSQMNREVKASKWLGWLNVILGLVLYIGSWFYRPWF